MRAVHVGVLAVVLVAVALVLRIAYVNDTPGYPLLLLAAAMPTVRS